MDFNRKDEEEEKEDIRYWKYIKEGNESLVIGHKKKNIVYKMWKRDAKDVSAKNSRESECWAKINYIKNCIQPVLGKYATIPTCISLSPPFVGSVSKAFESQRPLKRRHKVVDPCQRSVLCSPNFCFLDDVGKEGIPTLTVELKPKLGSIPNHQQLPPEINDHQPVCMFCMLQKLKRKEGDWEYTSEYCPVNLFSGDQDRMRYAMEGLFKTPQNNLCIFKDGEVMYPRDGKSLPTEEDIEEITMAIQSWFIYKENPSLSYNNTCLPSSFTKSVCIQDLISLVIQALCTSDNTLTFHEVSKRSSPWVPCHEGQCPALKHELNESKLPKGCVLERILAMQHMDTHGIEIIAKVYQRYMDHLTQQKEELSFTEQCLSSPPPTTASLNRRLSDDDISRLPLQDCVTLLQGYMMSRLARDCSILVTFKPADLTSSMDNDIVSLKEKRFHFACRLVDLDSKKLSKIPYYLKQEQLISRTYYEG